MIVEQIDLHNFTVAMAKVDSCLWLHSDYLILKDKKRNNKQQHSIDFYDVNVMYRIVFSAWCKQNETNWTKPFSPIRYNSVKKQLECYVYENVIRSVSLT